MADLDYAIDAYDADLGRRGMSPATRLKYRQILDLFAARYERVAPGDITRDDCRDFLALWTRPRPPRKGTRKPLPPASANTLALHHSILKGFFGFLHDEELIDQNPMDGLKPPKRLRPEYLPVVTTAAGDVARLINACDEMDELLCIGTLAYMGPRRTAAANLRRGDLDLDQGLARFAEKGGKTVTKPIPEALLELYRTADDDGIWLSPMDYVIPNRRAPRSPHTRSAKVVYQILERVAARARVLTHPHALRRAFAVQFDDQHPQQLLALQELLGHDRVETTQLYLRRKDMAKAMEPVRDLSFALPPKADVPPAGFEPALQPTAVPEPLRRKLAGMREETAREARRR
jgi:integrase